MVKELVRIAEKGNKCSTPERRVQRERLVQEWQDRWSRGSKGAWTRRIIPELETWIGRKHGGLNYHLTQALTGHGCFEEYLHKIGKAVSNCCTYCIQVPDSPEHTLFHCERW